MDSGKVRGSLPDQRCVDRFLMPPGVWGLSAFSRGCVMSGGSDPSVATEFAWTRSSCPPQGQSPNPGREFESVELGELGQRTEPKEKAPRRVIHFSSGETMEEYSTDEEEAEDPEAERKDLLSPPVDAVRSKMTWGPYFWFHMWRAATSTISACDYLGERMASLFGITSAKYQYAIDEYNRIKKEKEEEAEENRLSEEAERTFDQLESQEAKGEPIASADAQEEEEAAAASARPDATRQLENESPVGPNTITVPVVVTAT